jgi:hypothetical protein
LADTEMLLKRTFAYRRLLVHQPEIAEQLLDSTRAYAEQLKNLPAGVGALVDTTGFSPETVVQMLLTKSDLQLPLGEWSPSALFKTGNQGLMTLVGKMLEVRELNFDARGPGTPGEIANIINMWVGGKSLREIADAHFGSESDEGKKITECCRLIFQKLSQNASWGLGAIQSLAGIDVDSLTSEQRDAFRTLPAMIYYGCSTVEGVLMRSLSVPRSICTPLGDRFKSVAAAAATGESTRIGKARRWLSDAEVDVWNQAAGSGSLSGKDYRDIWLVLNGREPVI